MRQVRRTDTHSILVRDDREDTQQQLPLPDTQQLPLRERSSTPDRQEVGVRDGRVRVREPSAGDVGEGIGGGDVDAEAKTGGRACGEGGLEERVKEEEGGRSEGGSSEPSEETDMNHR